MRQLFIAEKPELGRAIAEALGGGSPKKGYIDCGENTVTWCFGHMLALCEPEDYDAKYKKWAFADLPLCFVPWRKKALAKSAEQLKIIGDFIGKADTIVNAGDPDPEGQLLIDEVLEHFKCRKPVKRVLINDNNTELVKRAIKSMSDNSAFDGLSKAAEARQVADQLYGFNMSRAYTLAVQSNRKLADDAPAIGDIKMISVGRVQTPILGLVVNRTAENKGHQKAFFHVVTASFDFGGDAIGGRLEVTDDAPKDEKGRITDEAYAANIVADIKGKEAEIYQITTTGKETPPPLPFNLLKLQSLAASRWHMKPDKVKDVTQKLREEYRLITYNRSDCQYLSEEQHADAPAVIAAVKKNIGEGNELAAAADPAIKGRVFDSSKVSAHHAIIPTIATPDMAKLNKDEANIYGVIAEYYLLQFLPNFKYDQTKIIMTCGKHTFTHISNKTTDPGWKGISNQKDEEEKDAEKEGEAEDAAPAKTHNASEKGTCAEGKAEKKETKPKPLYTMATLLSDLTSVAKYVKNPELRKTLLLKDKGKEGEHGGIGTAATRDEMIKTLFAREYITEEKAGKKTVIVPTEAGKALYASLPDVARTPDLTALWHQDFQEIERGAMKQKEFVEKLMAFITEEVNRVKAIPANTSANTVFCPKCESVLARRTGKNGAFWACIDRDSCGATYPDKDGKPDFTPREREEREELPCPKCGSRDGGKIRRINGKNGFFWGCSNRDDCGATFPDKDGKPDTTPKAKASENFKCGVCGSGLVRRKGGKSDNYFWGCSAYPKCKQTYSEKDNAPDYTKK